MSAADLNERKLAEDPALDVLTKHLGWRFVPAAELDADRDSPAVAVLSRRLAARLREFNPWLSDASLSRALRAVTHPEAASLVEAAEKVHAALIHGIAVEQDFGDGFGKRSRDVTFIDFDVPGRNEFLVTRQFRVKGPRNLVVADLVCFVNGLPIVVIEAKSPALADPLGEAIDQLLRYQEAAPDSRGLGATALFQTAQVLIATCGERARYGTTLTPMRGYAEWKDVWPQDVPRVAAKLGKKSKRQPLTAQETLLFGMLAPENLLEIVRTFTAFEIEHGRTVKKICRYQQFRAVRKTVEHILTAQSPREGGGVVWHTQGSGKSLTMLWLAVALRRLRPAENPLLLIVTDRTDLDRQIDEVFRRCGFRNPERAHSVESLQRLIAAGQGRTVITTIQKFQTRSDNPRALAEADNIFVLVDEAHRTQYGELAALMREALPNACFLGFTGTPIDKKDRNTRRVFGDYIDRYTIQEAEADGATVPIFYEPRMADLHIEGNTLDRLFDRAFRDKTPAEREAIKARYATRTAIAEAPERLRAIAMDVVEHYERVIAPNGFKAQFVACSREAAVRYKELLDELEGPECEVVITSQHNDPAQIARHRKTREQEKDVIARFKDAGDSLRCLIVCDKLTTGFDAPVEQVMYLDQGPIEHQLLQTIARVNRPAEGKTYGLIVDYWGVSADLQTALGISTGHFDAADVAPAMRPLDEQLSRVRLARQMALRFFVDCPRDDSEAALEACLDVLEAPAERTNFDRAFRDFSQALEMFLPDPRGLQFSDDLKWLGKVRAAARTRFRDEQLDLKDCGAKAKQLIADYLRSSGVSALLDAPVSIFSEKFDEHIASLGSKRAQASEMAHALTYELTVLLDENPVLYRTLRDRLEELLRAIREKRLAAAEQLKRLAAIRNEARHLPSTARDLGFQNEQAFAVYELLHVVGNEDSAVVREDSPADQSRSSGVNTAKRDLAHEILQTLEKLAVIDWTQKDDVQREMRRQIKEPLRAAGYGLAEIEPIATKLMDLARRQFSR